MRIARQYLLVLGALLATGCGGDGGTGNASVVQIAHFTIAPGTVTCGALAASPDTISMQVEMVNTTDTDASVTNAASFGTIIRSSTGDFVGVTAAAFATLPFTPSPALIRARTGDVTVRIALPTSALCSSNRLPANGFKDVQTSVLITTNSGSYTSEGATIHVFFQPL